ncbi:hypothetical protein KSP39_PZI018037 [Platanthera zijinensis]|uniref:Uncharacterized protein n=1 Tax=Platanthera zijinensis TaxID=2320716 RepID=A0AAP0FYR2_9ASPA
MQKEELQGGMTIQYLYKCITDCGYTSFNKVKVGSNHLESLFFTHLTFVLLCKMAITVYNLCMVIVHYHRYFQVGSDITQILRDNEILKFRYISNTYFNYNFMNISGLINVQIFDVIVSF